MGIDVKTLAAAKKYTKESLKGAGAVKGQKGEPGKDGKDAPVITNINVDENNVLLSTLSDGTTLNGGTIKTVKGDKGEPGQQGRQGIQGIQGEKGNDGYPFLIYKEYDSLNEFDSADFPEIGLMFMIKENGATEFPVYRYTGQAASSYSFITNLSGNEAIKGDKGDPGEDGEQGIPGQDGADGTTYTPAIGTVTAVEPTQNASASVTVNEATKTASFNFNIPKGGKGDKGDNGTDGINGQDGITPHIGSNKNWFIGNIDTGVLAEGKDGRSIQSVTTNNNEEIIIVYSDGTTQNIGKISIDVQADFLTEEGFGNLRYYNGKFQSFTNGVWVDAAGTPDNVLVVNMMPNPMQHIMGVYDYKEMHYKLKWTEPKNTVVDGQVICLVENVVIRRKLGSTPENENDGDLVMIVSRKDFGIHKDIWYIDETVSPSVGDIYYYKAFPMSTTGFYNTSSQNETGGIEARDYYLYGFTLDQNESDPDSMISYIEDNKKFRSAYMNYTTDSFYYGDWRNDDVFFMDFKPCMLKYDGTVDYYLNPDDYTLKDGGTPSDVTDTSYEGNAMIEFPKIYWKITDNGDDTANIYISDKKLDDGFHCWSHIDNNGNEIDYCYMPIYNGTYCPISGTTKLRLRSISNQTTLSCHHASGEIEEALANNLNDEMIWFTEVYSDRVLINLLILLIGKSTNTREKFGYGHYVGANQQSDIFMPGYTLDKKGLFWGSNNTWKPMKIFGMENWWGNQWRRIAGWINDHGTQKVKMTYGTSDGSTVNGYNLDGSGYIEIPDSTPTGVSGAIKKMLFTENGLIPAETNGSATTYYTDVLLTDDNQVNYAVVGGCAHDGYYVGALSLSISSAASFADFYVGTSVSCKPPAN